MSFKNYLQKTLFLFLVVTFASNAQEKYHKGTLQINAKKAKEAYILIDYSNPQKFQKTITYVDPVVYEKYQFTGKVKSSAKKTLEAKSILGFTLDDGRKFKTIKYRKPTKGLKKTLAPKYCLEQKTEGAIELYKFYSHTDGGKVTPELLDAMHENLSGDNRAVLEYIENNFVLIVKKGEKATTKNVLRMDLMNLIGDHSLIVEKYENNHYGVKELLLIEKNDYFLANPKMEAALLHMLSEYNTIGFKTTR
jgi:uncharacterized protein (DUF2344 family)